MTLRFGDTEYKDGMTISHYEFYEKLIESDELPVTSLISPGAYADAYQKAVDAGTAAMVKNTGAKTNMEVFWDLFAMIYR